MDSFFKLFKDSFIVIKKWMCGEYPLWVTYWVTGIVPQFVFMYVFDKFNNIAESGNIENIAEARFFAVMVIIIAIYIPFALFAIILSAIHYSGRLVWTILAILAAVRGGLNILKSLH